MSTVQYEECGYGAHDKCACTGEGQQPEHDQTRKPCGFGIAKIVGETTSHALGAPLEQITGAEADAEHDDETKK